ncbi:MAG TPA: hypothetical protein VK580_10730 [Steroidobacteraceae bacterium]|nr:hypothetical protein [Steroidobacteraceae bacterium]
MLDNYATQMGGINQQKLLAASQSYQTAETVASAPPGAAFETLSRVNPQAAAALKQKYADASPEDLDQDVRTFAQHIGIATHQYTGRETDFQNGVLVDKRDGRPVLGSDQVLTGLDAAGKQKAFEDGNSTITLANGLAGRKWQGSIDPSTGQPYTSNEAYVIAADRAARSSAAGGQTNTPATTPGQTSGPPTPSASPKQNAAPASTVATTTDPVLKTALADATYNYKPPTLPRPTTQEELEANKVTASDAAKNYQANANGLKTSSDEVTGASAKALQYFNAAKTILAQPDSKWAAGTPGDVAAMLSKLGINTDAGTTRAEVVKNLTQAALQGLKTTYGSKPAMFDVKVNLEQAFPEIKGDQGLPAVKNLIDENVRNLNYDVATGQRARAYLGAGKDPADFNKWNQQYFDRSATINPGSSQSNPSPTSAATGKTVTRTGTLNGRKVVQYSDGSTAYAQ